jgi:transposase
MIVRLSNGNGLNFNRSIGNPKSNLERIRSYLWDRGPRTKREILADVFGRPNVLRGHTSGLFALAIRAKLIRKIRVGSTVFYALPIL